MAIILHLHRFMTNFYYLTLLYLSSMAFLVGGSPFAAAQNGESLITPNGAQLTVTKPATVDLSSPMVKNLLNGKPLIHGDSLNIDRSQINGPGYNSLLPHMLMDGSGWQSSGGGGASLCFTNSEDKQLALDQIQNFGLLSDEMIEKAISIVTHESWEQSGASLDFASDYMAHHLDTSHPDETQWDFSKPHFKFQSKTKDEHIQRVDDLIYSHSPVFFERLRMVRRLMPRENWVPAKLTPIDDFEITPPINLMREDLRSCLHWPVIIRQFDFTPGTNHPIRIYYDPAIWNRLSPIDQALLTYHEEVYALANYLGHQKADQVRELVRKVFTYMYWSHLQIQYAGNQSLQSRTFQRDLSAIFGDYFKFFSNELMPTASQGPPATPASWFYKYYLATQNSDDDIRNCIRTHEHKLISDDERPALVQACNENIFNQLLEGEKMHMDPELAFILLVRFYVDFQNVIPGSEWLLFFNSNDANWKTSQHQDLLIQACESINSPALDHSKMSANFPHLPELARQYCQEYAN